MPPQAGTVAQYGGIGPHGHHPSPRLRGSPGGQPSRHAARYIGILFSQELALNAHILRTFAGLLAGLGMALSVAAEPVDGEVKKIDPEAGKITLKHGGIKSLDMPAIQMAFRVTDPKWLTTLQVGDKVRFSADKVNGQFTVTSIEVRK